MGLKIKDIIVKKEILLRDLKGKVLVVDAQNMLYQFLTTIRSIDGRPLTNSKGEVTSHLIGLFNRVTSLMEEGLKLCFVFDGKAPDLKKITWEKRATVKKEASVLLKKAEEAGDIEGMRKYSARTVVLTKEMIVQAKELLRLLGLPIVQAPSEGEAQAAYMVKMGDAYACISQDYDNLIFDCPILIRNLSIAGKKKRMGKLSFQTIKPELISLKENLEKMEIDRDQLIFLSILVGTDYNPVGIKGVGQKTALKLVREYAKEKKPFDEMFESLEWDNQYELSWKVIFDTIKDIPVTDDYKLIFNPIKEDELTTFLVEKNEFSEERVKSKLGKLKSKKNELSQTGLGSFM